MSLGGQSILSVRGGKEVGPAAKRSKPPYPFSVGPQRWPQTGGLGSYATKELSKGKQGRGGVSERVPFTPESWQATRELWAASPDAEMNL